MKDTRIHKNWISYSLKSLAPLTPTHLEFSSKTYPFPCVVLYVICYIICYMLYTFEFIPDLILKYLWWWVHLIILAAAVFIQISFILFYWSCIGRFLYSYPFPCVLYCMLYVICYMLYVTCYMLSVIYCLIYPCSWSWNIYDDGCIS